MKPAVARTFAPLSALIGLLVLIKILDLHFEPNHVYSGRTAAFSWAELGLAALAALIGGLFAERTPLVRIRPGPAGARAFARATGLGLALGGALAGLDSWLRIGDANVGLPLAPVFYLWGGISQQLLTHFLPVAVVVGLLAWAGATGRTQELAFRGVAVAMALVAALSMAAAFGHPDIPLVARFAAAPMIVAAAVLVIELALFGLFRRDGLLAALSARLAFYAVWHVAWPALAY